MPPVLLLTVYLSVLSLPACFAAGCAPRATRAYKNNTYAFQLSYPSRYTIKEYRWQDEQQGAHLKSTFNYIDIRASGAGTMYDEMPFDEYVKIAAAAEIQNYHKLISIEAFTSDHGIKGYRTWWEVLQAVPGDDPDAPAEAYVPETVGPIYYFPPKQKYYSGKQPIKTIMLSYSSTEFKEKDTVHDLWLVAKSFKYL